jgi:filamentous hemagglutinin family protein
MTCRPRLKASRAVSTGLGKAAHRLGWGFGCGLWLLPWLGSVGLYPVWAQSIRPAADGTGTVVTPNGNQISITGGQRSRDGGNLFHSFSDFGLSSNQIATFLSNPQIQNILARVNGGNPSVINGLLQVTGGHSNLFLINPAGIVFGSNAGLNVPAVFTATTANGIGLGGNWLSATGANDYANLVGNPTAFAFTIAQPGAIINAGNLAVGRGQNLTLLGGTVINTGTLTAPDGTITIAAVPGQNLVRFSQQGSLLSIEFSPLPPSSSPTSPSAPPSVAQLLTGGNLSNATGITVNPDGTVQLTGSGTQIPNESGVAIASGTLNTAGQTGGNINILGNKVGLVTANIDASGISGGGTVRVGGDYQGKSTIPNASHTLISSDSVINANALQTGNGGRVIIWSDNVTQFYGTINARGGVQSGNGGFVETSGKHTLTSLGIVDASATNGLSGQWLLDPNNITIQAAGADTNITGAPNFTSTNDNAIVTTASIQTALNAGTGVTITTASAGTNLQDGNITVASPITKTTGGNASLTLQANNSIFVNADITSTSGALDVILDADADNTGGGALNIANATVTTNGGNFTGIGRGNATSAAGVNIGGSTIDVGNGSINLTGTGGTTALGNAGIGIASNSILQATGSGTIALTGVGGTSNGGDSNNGVITSGTITSVDGAISLTGTGGNNSVANSGSGHGGIELGAGTRIESTGVGTIALEGQGISQGIDANGIPTGNSSHGILFRTDVTIRSNTGNIGLTGIATGGGSGIVISNDPGSVNDIIESTGSGSIRLNGATQAYSSYGVVIGGEPSRISAANGNAEITGTFNTGTNVSNFNRGVYIQNATLEAPQGIVSLTGGSTNGVQGVGLDGVALNTQTLNLAGTTAFAKPLSLSAETINADTIITDFVGVQNPVLGLAPLTLQANQINVGSINTPGESVTLISQGDIAVGTIDTSSTTTDAGAITLNAGRNITLGGNLLSRSTSVAGSSGNGGDVTLIAANGEISTNNSSISAISTGAVNSGNGGAVTIRAGNGSIANFDQIATISQSTGTGNAQNAGNIVMEARNGNIVVDRVDARSIANSGNSGNGGNISLNAPEGNITARSLQSLSQANSANIANPSQAGDGGSISLASNSANGIIDLFNPSRTILVRSYSQVGTGGSGGKGGDINFIGGEIRLSSYLDAAYITGTPTLGGKITLTASQTITLDNPIAETGINTSNNNITLNSSILLLKGNKAFNSPVTLQANTIDTTSSTIFGIDNATITLLANQDINTGDIINPGRAINLNARSGSIRAGNLNSSGNTGGNINLRARLAITTGAINSSGAVGAGGNVFIDPITDVQVSSINTQGGTFGGNVDVTAGRFFRAVGLFSDRNNTLASISTAGGLGGGAITIRHNGGQTVPFVIGQPSINGTTGAITTGSNNTIAIGTFRASYRQGNPPSQIQILTQDPVAPPERIPERPSVNNLTSQSCTTCAVVSQLEDYFTPEYDTYLGKKTPTKSLDQVQQDLNEIELKTGTRPAIIYAFFTSTQAGSAEGSGKTQSQQVLSDVRGLPRLGCNPSDLPDTCQLSLVLVTAKGTPVFVRSPNSSRSTVIKQAGLLYDLIKGNVTPNPNPDSDYTIPAQQFYRWLIKPLASELALKQINNLVFVLDEKLRTLPLAAIRLPETVPAPQPILLSTGDIPSVVPQHSPLPIQPPSTPASFPSQRSRFLIDQYSVGMVPSMSLVDTRYVSLKGLAALVVGNSKFTNQPGLDRVNDLPNVPLEVTLIREIYPDGNTLLNAPNLDKPTLEQQRQGYELVHLATHGFFEPGDRTSSYLRLERAKLTIDDIAQFQWKKPPVQLLVLSACKTAVGDKNAELGFAGLAVHAGVKTAIASLWTVDDAGTTALMTEFYSQLGNKVPIRAEALRRAQVALLDDTWKPTCRALLNTAQAQQKLTPQMVEQANKLLEKDFRHPHFWAGFTMIGYPW